MVTITAKYQGELHCEATHPSGARLETDAPKDNNGRGESFSPTDLVATAIGTCALTVMGILARKLDVNMEGAALSIEKTMTPPPRRIASLNTVITMPKDIAPEHREKLEEAANQCPVKKSLHPDIDLPITFIWN